jgi:hypothetical protein
VEGVARLLACFLAEIELELGIGLPEIREHPREEEWSDRRDDAHAELAAEGQSGGLGEAGDFLGFAEEAPGALDDLLAERREANPLPGALDQFRAKQLFELLNPRRERRLGYEASLGGATEMALIVNRDEILELSQRWEIGRHFNRFNRCINKNQSI